MTARRNSRQQGDGRAVNFRVRKIISGGQTGGDQGGLAAGTALGLATGGTAPRGFRTDVGPAPFLADLGLVQHSSSGYPPRTRANVQEADGTLIFGNAQSPGCRLTQRLCVELRKPYHIVAWTSGGRPSPRAVEFFRVWLDDYDIEVLNVAGNRESQQPGIAQAVYDFLLSSIS